jgi:hypothetical protein
VNWVTTRAPADPLPSNLWKRESRGAMEQVFCDAIEAAKAAAKCYSRRPSLAKAEQVDAAWRRILALYNINRSRRLAGPQRPTRDARDQQRFAWAE